MPDTYTGNATSEHAPSPAPALDHEVKIQVPTDGDPPSGSTFQQPYEVLADWVEFLRGTQSTYRGLRAWDSAATYTAGMTVVSAVDSCQYRALRTNANQNPSFSPDDWTRCDYGYAEIMAMTSDTEVADTGIACSHGAAGRSTMIKFKGGIFNVILLSVQGIPVNNYTDVDLNASTTKFASTCYGGLPGLMSGGYQYGGQVGININIGSDENVVRVWHKKGSGDPATTVTVGVVLFGM